MRFPCSPAPSSLAVAGTAFAQAKYQLRWGHYLADGPFVQLEKDYAAKIEKRTNGQVKITITFAGGLGKGEELLMLTARGAIDMTATAPGYNPDQLRYWRAFQTPLVFQTTQQAMMVLGKVYEEFPVYREEMDKIGVVWLLQQPLGEYYLSGPSPDCTSVAALKGKKIRSFGADIPKAFSAIGAVPVTVAPTAIYEALQHRNLDFSFINPGNIQQYKLVEVGKHHCGPVMAITGHNVTISKRTWTRLPPDIQKIIHRGRAADDEGLSRLGRRLRGQGGGEHQGAGRHVHAVPGRRDEEMEGRLARLPRRSGRRPPLRRPATPRRRRKWRRAGDS